MRDRIWDRLRRTALSSAGTMTLPESDAGTGVDLLTQAPEIGTFLRRGALFTPAYVTPGVVDVLVPQQGANYTLAKRVQRWRATAAQAAGHLVSANVAPATRTRSVTKNTLLAAAYGGAGRFGVEVFAPATSRVLMAALLVHDLRAETPTPEHPDALFADQAAHGGLWRIGYLPRSVLGLAAITGLPSALRESVTGRLSQPRSTRVVRRRPGPASARSG